MEIQHQNDPLYGMTLEKILVYLIDRYGYRELYRRIPINCFLDNPSIPSALKFLRRTPWARAEVEGLYVSSVVGGVKGWGV